METDLLKLMQPQRLEGESVEDYRIRRLTARKYNKLNAQGTVVHTSKWYSVVKDDEGNDKLVPHHNTYVKPKEEANA